MMRTAAVMAWLRWRLLVNHLRPSRRRDALERASRAFAVIGPVILLVLFLPALLLAAFGGGAAGYFLPQSTAHHRPILLVMRLILSAELFLTLMAPMLRAAQGSLPNLERFLLLPVPVRHLYLSEALGALGNPWLALLAASVLLLPVGLWMAGLPVEGLMVLGAGAGILVLLAGVETCFLSLASLLFRDRRRAEVASFVLVAIMAGMGFLPGLLSTLEPARRRMPDTAKTERAPEESRPAQVEAPGQRVEPLPLWGLAYPPELYARTVLLCADRRVDLALAPLCALVVWGAGVHAAGVKLYRRILETPEVSSPRRRGGGMWAVWPRLPGLSHAASAIAVAEVRLVFRTVQGKIQFFVLPLMILVISVLWTRRPETALFPTGPLPMGLAIATLGIFLAMMTLEGALLNQFAMDRAGLTLTFLSPISDRDLILGKAAAGAFLVASRALPAMSVAALVAPGGSIFLWLALPFVALALYAWMAPLGAILSAVFPRPVDTGKIVKQNQPHAMASILGMLANLLGVVPMMGLAGVALFLLHSPALALLFVILYCGIALLVSLLLLRLAERVLAQRRENLALVAQGR